VNKILILEHIDKEIEKITQANNASPLTQTTTKILYVFDKKVSSWIRLKRINNL